MKNETGAINKVLLSAVLALVIGFFVVSTNNAGLPAPQNLSAQVILSQPSTTGARVASDNYIVTFRTAKLADNYNVIISGSKGRIDFRTDKNGRITNFRVNGRLARIDQIISDQKFNFISGVATLSFNAQGLITSIIGTGAKINIAPVDARGRAGTGPSAQLKVSTGVSGQAK